MSNSNSIFRRRVRLTEFDNRNRHQFNLQHHAPRKFAKSARGTEGHCTVLFSSTRHSTAGGCYCRFDFLAGASVKFNHQDAPVVPTVKFSQYEAPEGGGRFGRYGVSHCQTQSEAPAGGCYCKILSLAPNGGC